MSRRSRTLFIAAPVGLVVAFGAVGGAWAADNSAHSGKVARNVSLAGKDVSGLTAAQLRGRVGDLSARYPSTPVRVESVGGGFDTTARDIGLSIDEEATITAALRTGRTGGPISRIVGWVGGLVSPREAPVVSKVDIAATTRVVAAKDTQRTAPTEPSFVARNGHLEVVAGKDGRGIDPKKVAAALREEPVDEHGVQVDVKRGRVAPRWSRAEASALVKRAEDLTAKPLPVKAGAASASIPTPRLREWLTVAATTDVLDVALDPAKTRSGLADLLKAAGTPAVNAGFAVQGGGVVVTPAKKGTGCCAPEAVDAVLMALKKRPAGAVDLPLTSVDPARTDDKAAKLGIKEPIGSFTTRHKAGEARVTNIHRISDLARGMVIEPGATFSVNDAIGKRTVDKGFVLAPVIQNGEHDEDIGGGVSQFATTLFNASFFGGLDFGEYQSHSLYISRYPYGREATMGFPHPDLQIKNTTPFGVLIWPTYTSTSITITLYSTKYASGDQTDQTKTMRGSCTVVTTERTRHYVDGTVKKDSVRATYRAAEGQDCNEDHPTLSTSTTAKPATTPTTAKPPSAPTTATPAPTPTPTTAKPAPTPTTVKRTTVTTTKR